MSFAVDDPATSGQYKRKTPSIGRTPNDVTRQSSSVKQTSTQAEAAKLIRNDESLPISQILSLMLDLSRNVATMRDVINDIRFQNHVAYRQLKRIQLQQGKCNSIGGGGALMTSPASTAYQHKKPEMGRKLQSFMKSGNLKIFIFPSLVSQLQSIYVLCQQLRIVCFCWPKTNNKL
jgi:hypothetical protein